MKCELSEDFKGKRRGRWDGDELVVDVKRRQEETGDGLAVSGSQAWGVGPCGELVLETCAWGKRKLGGQNACRRRKRAVWGNRRKSS